MTSSSMILSQQTWNIHISVVMLWTLITRSAADSLCLI